MKLHAYGTAADLPCMMEMGMEAWEKGYIVLRVWAIWHWAFETHGTGNIDYMVHVGNLCYIVRGTWTVLHSTLDQAGIDLHGMQGDMACLGLLWI